LYCKEGEVLPKVFELTLKDDARGDPPATCEIVTALGLLTSAEYEEIQRKTIIVCDIIKKDLDSRGLDLIDIKLEFGFVDGKIILIDEISPGNMRVFKAGKKLDYLELVSLI
jgi:phosphoribosylaminoimidazole-succinocarboxamide synthase